MFVLGRQDEGARRVGAHAIEAGDEDGLHGAVARGAGVERTGTGGFEAGRAVAFAEAEEPETGAVALLGMGEALQQLLDELPDGGAEARAPGDHARGRPLDVALVGLRPVRGVGREAAPDTTPHVRRDAAAAVQDLDGRGGEADLA